VTPPESSKLPEQSFIETLRAALVTVCAEAKDEKEKALMVAGVASFDTTLKSMQKDAADISAKLIASKGSVSAAKCAEIATQVSKEIEIVLCRLYGATNSRWGNVVKKLCLGHLATTGRISEITISDADGSLLGVF